MDTQVSPWLSNYATNVDAVAPGFVQGSAEGGAAIGRGLADFAGDMFNAMKEHRQNVQDQANVDTGFKMVTQLAQRTGTPVDPDLMAKFAGMSLSAKKGALGALSANVAGNLDAQQKQAQIGELQARGQYYGDVGAARAEAEQEKVDEGAGLSAFAQQLQATKPSGEGGAYTPQDYMSALAGTTGKLNPRAQGALLNKVLPSVMSGQPGARGANPFFTPGDQPVAIPGVPGAYRVATGPNTSEIVYAQPDGSQTTAQPVVSPDGQLQGYNIPGGKGKMTFKAAGKLTDNQKQSLILGHQKQVSELMQQLPYANGQTNILNALNDQIGEHRAAIKQLQTGSGLNASSGAGTGQPPKPSDVVTTQEQFDALPSGAQYTGTDGVIYQKP